MSIDGFVWVSRSAEIFRFVIVIEQKSRTSDSIKALINLLWLSLNISVFILITRRTRNQSIRYDTMINGKFKLKWTNFHRQKKTKGRRSDIFWSVSEWNSSTRKISPFLVEESIFANNQVGLWKPWVQRFFFFQSIFQEETMVLLSLERWKSTLLYCPLLISNRFNTQTQVQLNNDRSSCYNICFLKRWRMSFWMRTSHLIYKCL